jgi:hypothetical protein
VLDTKALKSKNLVVRLTATQNGKTQVRELRLRNEAKEVGWVDARVDRNSKEVEVTLRPSFSDGGVDGKAPAGVQVTPLTFKQLEALAAQGIEYYWSRDGSRPGGIGAPVNTAKGTFKVNVKVDLVNEPKAKNFRLFTVLKDKLSNIDRSHSIGRLSKICFNIIYDGGFASEQYKKTAAHEFGHRILDEYAPDANVGALQESELVNTQTSSAFPRYSSTHKGTSGYDQDPLPNNPYPRNGEVDLMHYHSDVPRNAKDFIDKSNRTVASKEDTKSLFWLSRIQFITST